MIRHLRPISISRSRVGLFAGCPFRLQKKRYFGFFSSDAKVETEALLVQSEEQQVLDGIKQIYSRKIRPVEEKYRFSEFYSPLLRDVDFDAKPMVMLLGQYSTGKTTFINTILGKPYPGQYIGPEPTTDKFISVMYGKEERVIPGNAVSVDASLPFDSLGKYGSAFFHKFQASEVDSPMTEKLIFIDTPGVLSGEKQRIGRSYDFEGVCEWFAQRSDLILLLFDAHKLDISDEFKRTIEGLRGQEDKIRIVLNKADVVGPQQLMRVYGALMWALSRIIPSAEVNRVYLGSFNGQPYEQGAPNSELFEMEEKDLMKDLHNLPRGATIRRVNELVKRARLATVHAHIISHLRTEMPMFFGKDDKQEDLIHEIPEIFDHLAKRRNLPRGDFPNVQSFREKLELGDYNFRADFPKFDDQLIGKMHDALASDIPALMAKLTSKNH